MNLSLVAGGLAVVGLSTYTIGRYRGCRVNCWFCNTNQQVPWSSKNSFVCTQCDQYNGFTADGDYNKRIIEQFIPTTKKQGQRFCRSVLSNDRPDVVPSIFENVLCEECNQKQEIIVERISQFEPRNESHFEAELDDYKNRLNKIYALCESCLMASQRKLARDRNLYGYLAKLKNFSKKLTARIGFGNNSSPKIKKRRRKYFFSGGSLTEINHFIVFCLSSLVAFAEFNFLQQYSSEIPSIDYLLPSILRSLVVPFLGIVHSYFYHIIILLFIAHSVTFVTNKCRISLPDLLVVGVSLLLLMTSYEFPRSYQDDIILMRCGFSCLLFCIATTVWVSPRKLKHRKRPNTISSAFSVASTPVSQCSTIRSGTASLNGWNGSHLNGSPNEDFMNLSSRNKVSTTPSQISFGDASNYTTRTNKKPNSGLFDFNHHQEQNKENCSPKPVSTFSSSSRTPSVISRASSLSQWRDTRETTPISPDNGHGQMEWEHSDIHSPSIPVLRQRQSSPSRIGLNRKSRETTPSRELGGMFGGLKLGKGGSSSPRGGPFGSLSFHPGVRSTYSVTSRNSFETGYDNKSHYTGFTSVSQQPANPWAMPPSLRSRITNDDLGSISTRVTESSPQFQSQSTQMLLVTLVLLCFLSNVFLIYYLFSRS